MDGTVAPGTVIRDGAELGVIAAVTLAAMLDTDMSVTGTSATATLVVDTTAQQDSTVARTMHLASMETASTVEAASTAVVDSTVDVVKKSNGLR